MIKKSQKTDKHQSKPKKQETSTSSTDVELNSILEVIVEARFSVSEWTEEIPIRLHDILSKRLPNLEIQGLVGASGAALAFEGHRVAPHAPEIQLWNSERTELLQLGPRVLIANVLRHTSREAVAHLLKEGLSAFCEVLDPARVESLSFRVINQFALADGEKNEISLEKFFRFYAGLPKDLREIEGLQISFQTKLDLNDTHSAQAASQAHLNVELRSASEADLTLLADGRTNLSPGASFLLLDIDTRCACEGKPILDQMCATAEQLHAAAAKALKSIVRPILLKKYHLHEW